MGRQDEFRFMTDALLDERRGEWSDSGVAPSLGEAEVLLCLAGVDGLACAERVAGAVAAIKGVRAVCITLETGAMLVRFDASGIGRWQFERAVGVMGCSVVADTQANASGPPASPTRGAAGGGA